MVENKLTRRQALKVAGAAALGGLAATTFGGSRIARADEGEPWESYVDERIEIEMGSMFFQVKGQEKNAPITLQIGKIYLLEFVNLDAEVHHNALLGKDPDVENHHYKTLLIDNFFGVELEGGQAGEIFFQVPNKPGEWEMGCFVSGHYEAGMKAPLIVK